MSDRYPVMPALSRKSRMQRCLVAFAAFLAVTSLQVFRFIRALRSRELLVHPEEEEDDYTRIATITIDVARIAVND